MQRQLGEQWRTLFGQDAMTSPGAARPPRRTAGRRSVPAALAPGLQLEGQWRPLPYRLRLPYSSIDVSYDWPGWGGATYTVTAANSGTVTVFSRCQVRVTAPNGWATNYYHMSGISGAQRRLRGRRHPHRHLCRQPQRGAVRGRLLHRPAPALLLLYNGVFQSLQGQKLSSYAVNVGASNYDDNCNRFWLYHQRNGQRYCAWQPLYNNGID